MKEIFEKLKRQSSTRIKFIIDEYCDGVQQTLVEKTGVSKGSISHYVNGRNVPNNFTAKQIAQPFAINPAWVMGFDVPMKWEPEKKELQIDNDEADIIEKYRDLNKDARKMAAQYIDYLRSIPENRKSK